MTNIPTWYVRILTLYYTEKTFMTWVNRVDPNDQAHHRFVSAVFFFHFWGKGVAALWRGKIATRTKERGNIWKILAACQTQQNKVFTDHLIQRKNSNTTFLNASVPFLLELLDKCFLMKLKSEPGNKITKTRSGVLFLFILAMFGTR